MWSDNETDVDYLNHTEVAELVSEMIGNQALHPMSIGIYGSWGEGKSSILHFIRNQLRLQQNSMIVEFDAWLYQGFDEAKSALMTVIAQNLVAQSPETLRQKAIALFKRANKVKFLSLFAEAGMASMGLPTFGLASKGLNSLADIASGEGDSEDIQAIKQGAASASNQLSGLFNPKEVKSPPEEISQFKEEFSEFLRDLDRTLVVFVDNLDRCLPQTAIQNLEAMRLFLSMPNTVFIVAADVEMIRHAVSREFSGPSKKHVDDYLDKLIQFPVTVPKLGLQEVQAYLALLAVERNSALTDANKENIRQTLIEKIRNSWSDNSPISINDLDGIGTLGVEDRNSIENLLRAAPVLAHSSAVQGNPRIIKRLMNVVSMRLSLAKRRKMNLDETVIAKLSIFERCTSSSAFKDLLDKVNESGNGKVESLATDSLAELAQNSDQWPDSWSEYKTFILEWAQLLPDLSSIDLRPAVYLARETLPIHVRPNALSSIAANAVKSLLKIPSQASKTGSKIVAEVPSSEVTTVMMELIAHLRKISDWGSKPKELNGPILLSEISTEAKAILLQFLDSLPDPKPWLRYELSTLKGETS